MTVSDGSAAAERHAQLLRGTLDMCLLALLAREPVHGYELVRRCAAAGFGTVGYGTVYPLLTRLRRLGLVTDQLLTSPTGPARKVYRLTDDGRRVLLDWTRQWRDFVRTVETTIADGSASAPGGSNAAGR